MRLYERYLFSHLVWPAVLITVSLTGIVWLTQVLRFLDFTLSRGLTLADFFYLTGLVLPSLLLILMPITLCIAVIYTYNKLTTESELIVLSAVGVSKWQLARPVMVLGAICVVICYALSFYIMPIANQRFRDIRSLFRDKYASVLLEEEVFNNPVDGVTVFVRERDSMNNLEGILLHDNRDPKQTITMIAEHGRVEQTPAGPKFYLQQGLRQQQQKDGSISWLAFDDYAIEIAFYSSGSSRSLSPEERTISELMQRDGLPPKEAAAFRAEMNQRLTWPAFALVLPMFALAALFSSEFNRRGQARRIVLASIGIGLHVLLYFSLRNVMLKHAWLAIILYGVVLSSGLFSAYMLYTGRMLRFTRRPVWPAGGEA